MEKDRKKILNLYLIHQFLQSGFSRAQFLLALLSPPALLEHELNVSLVAPLDIFRGELH